MNARPHFLARELAVRGVVSDCFLSIYLSPSLLSPSFCDVLCSSRLHESSGWGSFGVGSEERDRGLLHLSDSLAVAPETERHDAGDGDEVEGWAETACG